MEKIRAQQSIDAEKLERKRVKYVENPGMLRENLMLCVEECTFDMDRPTKTFVMPSCFSRGQVMNDISGIVRDAIENVNAKKPLSRFKYTSEVDTDNNGILYVYLTVQKKTTMVVLKTSCCGYEIDSTKLLEEYLGVLSPSVMKGVHCEQYVVDGTLIFHFDDEELGCTFHSLVKMEKDKEIYPGVEKYRDIALDKEQWIDMTED